jgi:hypothetical protein
MKDIILQPGMQEKKNKASKNIWSKGPQFPKTEEAMSGEREASKNAKL